MIPEELKSLKQWCVWKYEERNGKTTKIPYDPNTLKHAKSNDEQTWADLDTARQVLQKTDANGLGFFFKPPYMGIDLDDVAEDIERFKQGQHTDNIVSEFYNTLKSYGETSPSGKGIHIILKGRVPDTKKRRNNVEMYDKGRFFTMTGNTLGKYENITEANLEELYEKYIQPPKNNVIQHQFKEASFHELNESEIINKILDSKQADLFKALMNDGWQKLYPSQSEADIALANILAFWCAKDFSKMDSIFRQSSLMRDKWDAKRGKTTYGASTLNRAINDTQNVYRPKNKQTDPLKYTFNFIDKAPEEFPLRSWDDTGNAERFVDRYGDIVRYSYTHKKFYVYDGSVWKLDDMGQVRLLIDATIEDLKNEKIKVPDDMDEEEAQKAFRRFIKTSRSNNKKTAIMNEIKHRLSIGTNEFDEDDMALNVQNGFIDLSNGEVYPHELNKYFSKIANFDYTDKESPDTWLDFLNEIFDYDSQTINYIQKALGYSLTGSTREQVMFILHGKGRNGKSLFVETISQILGDYTKTVRADSLMVKRSGGVNNDIAALQGARFVTSSEPNEGFRFDEGLIKQLTGGDTVTARFLYGEDFEFQPKFKLWVTTNHKPIVRGTDDGIWRRLMLIPFDVQIPEHKVDKDLKYKLLREAPAILNWMMEGAIKWQKNGLTPPPKISEASREYRNDMDVLEHFIADECTRVEGGSAPAGRLYDVYKKWADDTGEYKMNKNTFGKKMKEKFERKRTGKGNVYLGLVIKENYPGLMSIK